MGIKLDLSGLEKIKKKIEELANTKQMPVSNWLTDAFVRANFDFQSAQEMIDASGIESGEDEVTPALDQFVVLHSKSKFSGWEEMKYAAFAQYVEREMES